MNVPNDRQGLAAVSCLMTREDFIDFKAAAARMALKPNEVTMLRAAGFVMVLAGFLLRVFLGTSAYRNTVYTLLVVLGLVLGFFYDTLQPYFVRQRAGAYYDHFPERMAAQNVIFYEERVLFTTDRYTGFLPYDMLYGVYEDKKVFLLYSGLDEIRAVPKRAMSPEDVQKVRGVLTSRLGQKYTRDTGEKSRGGTA